MDDKNKKLKRMSTWTIAIFAVVFAIVLVIFWLINFQVSHNTFKALGDAFVSSWPILLLDLVLCGGTYIGYSYYLKSKK